MPPLQLAGRFTERGDRPLGDRCPVDRTMQLLGNRTAVLLVREAFYGATRFDSFAQRVGVTDAVASQRLRELVEAGVLVKQPYREPGQRTRYEYVLTEAGHALLPVLAAMLAWGDTHLPPAPSVSRSRVHVEHAGCGEPVEVVTRCAAGHDVPEEELVVVGTRQD